jgi:hypothetical protein
MRHLLALIAVPAVLNAQAFDVRAGASTLYDGFGVATGFWSEHYDGWLGVGYKDEWRYGGFLRLRTSRDSIELGNNVLSVRLPTDVFADEVRLLVQGVRIASYRGETRLGAFVGATARAQSMPLFAAHAPERVFGGLRFDDRIARRLRAGGIAILTQTPTLLGYVDVPGPQYHTFGFTAGLNSGAWYRAYSTVVARDRFEWRSSYILPDHGFRRATVPMPAQTSLEGLNIEATLQPFGGAFISAARHAFVSDSESGTSRRAHGVSAVLGYTGESAHIVTGTYISFADSTMSHSGYIAAGIIAGRRFGADFYLMSTRYGAMPRKHLPALLLHEHVHERLTLDQALTGFGKGGSVGLGGSYTGRFGEYGLHYQIVNDPFDTQNPFKRTANLSVRLQLGDYNANVSSTMAADGAMTYTAVAERFLYTGAFNGTGPSPLRVRLERFIIEGTVQDEQGTPIAGAAIALDDELLFTDSRGYFFARVSRKRPYAVAVRLDDFLALGSYTVIAAPESATPQIEGRTTPMVIVLRRAR